MSSQLQSSSATMDGRSSVAGSRCLLVGHAKGRNDASGTHHWTRLQDHSTDSRRPFNHFFFFARQNTVWTMVCWTWTESVAVGSIELASSSLNGSVAAGAPSSGTTEIVVLCRGDVELDELKDVRCNESQTTQSRF